MKQDNTIKIKSTDFAVRIIKMVKYLVKSIPIAEHSICTQLLKSGTSIGANVREAEHAESTEDFIHKMKIALKEANETEYWLEIFFKTEYITQQQYKSLNDDCIELNKLLISIIKSMKSKQQKDNI
ncbi:MAG: four helix bundle protein [Prevotella sp.]|nr:four helix bundle protein [Prevotella sp.]